MIILPFYNNVAFIMFISLLSSLEKERPLIFSCYYLVSA